MLPPGSSKMEPGVSPAESLEMFYTKWSEVQHTCGQSRLYGGMHFSKAIPAGEELCTGVASLIVERANLLKDGDANGALADLNDTSIKVKVRRSPHSPSKSFKSSKESSKKSSSHSSHNAKRRNLRKKFQGHHD